MSLVRDFGVMLLVANALRHFLCRNEQRPNDDRFQRAKHRPAASAESSEPVCQHAASGFGRGALRGRRGGWRMEHSF